MEKFHGVELDRLRRVSQRFGPPPILRQLLPVHRERDPGLDRPKAERGGEGRLDDSFPLACERVAGHPAEIEQQLERRVEQRKRLVVAGPPPSLSLRPSRLHRSRAKDRVEIRISSRERGRVGALVAPRPLAILDPRPNSSFLLEKNYDRGPFEGVVEGFGELIERGQTPLPVPPFKGGGGEFLEQRGLGHVRADRAIERGGERFEGDGAASAEGEAARGRDLEEVVGEVLRKVGEELSARFPGSRLAYSLSRVEPPPRVVDPRASGGIQPCDGIQRVLAFLRTVAFPGCRPMPRELPEPGQIVLLLGKLETIYEQDRPDGTREFVAGRSKRRADRVLAGRIDQDPALDQDRVEGAGETKRGGG